MKKILLLLLSGSAAVLLSGCVLNEPEISQDTNRIEPSNEKPDETLDFLKTPPGFTISYYADNVPGARSLALASDGTVFVGTRAEGKVYALTDKNQDGQPDEVLTVASGLNSPNGVAVKDGSLYVAEISRILKFPSILANINNPISETLPLQLPSDRSHGWKYLAFGPDGALYIPIGAPCNICKINPPYASLNRYDLFTGQLTPIATGIRNTVGFDWHPETGKLWFTDNGRDGLGDDIPPDELNRLDQNGEFFGYPQCHGKSISDPEFGLSFDCSKTKTPIVELDPHGAALGIKFYTGAQFPEKYKNTAFIAEHGSWDRTEKIGYKIFAVPTNGDNTGEPEDFITGWLTKDSQVLGRPVDILQLEDGSILISDDQKGAIYRVSYGQ